MGTWGTDVFDDDISMDIKAEFDNAIAEGMSLKQATKQILVSFSDVLNDEEEGPLVYIVLAALQIRQGTVIRKIKQEALKIISAGQGLERWEEAGEELFNKRKCVLNDLKSMLLITEEI